MGRDRRAHREAAAHWAGAGRRLAPLLAEARSWRDTAAAEWLAALHAGAETAPAAARLDAAQVAYAEWAGLLLRADFRLAEHRAAVRAIGDELRRAAGTDAGAA